MVYHPYRVWWVISINKDILLQTCNNYNHQDPEINSTVTKSTVRSPNPQTSLDLLHSPHSVHFSKRIQSRMSHCTDFSKLNTVFQSRIPHTILTFVTSTILRMSGQFCSMSLPLGLSDNFLMTSFKLWLFSRNTREEFLLLIPYQVVCYFHFFCLLILMSLAQNKLYKKVNVFSCLVGKGT